MREKVYWEKYGKKTGCSPEGELQNFFIGFVMAILAAEHLC
jgi:hypothetical protein